MNLNELREAMASDATKENEKLKEENARLRHMVENLERDHRVACTNISALKEDCRALINRCFVLTHGTMCCFCELRRYRCSHALTDMEKVERRKKMMEEAKNAEN
nr:MAG TPA: hypothetical protein [Caudoviricetes sp.]